MADCNIVKIKHGLETGEWQVPLTVLDLSGNDITEGPFELISGIEQIVVLVVRKQPH